MYRLTQNAMVKLVNEMEGRWMDKEFWEARAQRYVKMLEWAEKRWSWADAYNLDRKAHWGTKAGF